MIHDQYSLVPERITAEVGDYFLHRKATMMRLEQRDLVRVHQYEQQH